MKGQSVAYQKYRSLTIMTISIPPPATKLGVGGYCPSIRASGFSILHHILITNAHISLSNLYTVQGA